MSSREEFLVSLPNDVFDLVVVGLAADALVLMCVSRELRRLTREALCAALSGDARRYMHCLRYRCAPSGRLFWDTCVRNLERPPAAALGAPFAAPFAAAAGAWRPRCGATTRSGGARCSRPVGADRRCGLCTQHHRLQMRRFFVFVRGGR